VTQDGKDSLSKELEASETATPQEEGTICDFPFISSQNQQQTGETF
jgi:hypothetical protein